jgi:hypothetical protein
MDKSFVGAFQRAAIIAEIALAVNAIMTLVFRAERLLFLPRSSVISLRSKEQQK